MKQCANLPILLFMSTLTFVILTVVYDKLIFRNRLSGWPSGPTGATGSIAHKCWFRTTCRFPGDRRRAPPHGSSSLRRIALQEIARGPDPGRRGARRARERWRGSRRGRGGGAGGG